MNKTSEKVFVAMSGGVDSSVAALLLKNDGYDVTGVFMRCYNVDGCQDRDAEDARRVAEKLGIPFYVWDFEKEYKKRVVEYMVDGYRRGLTPNPDVMCNKEIKFGLFFDRAMRMGADFVATGHYVRLNRTVFRKQHNFLPARKFASPSARHPAQAGTKLAGLRDVPQDSPVSPLFSIFVAKDQNKDQSYFLWTLTQEKLQRCLFPIGDYLKSEVREIARVADLPTAEKKDSQGICFLGQVTLADFLKQYLPEKKGEVLLAMPARRSLSEGGSDVEGNVSYKKVGEHAGAHFYTIGQRHLGIRHQTSGIRGRHETPPVYVVEKDVVKNEIVVAEGRDNSALCSSKVTLDDVNFIKPLDGLIRAPARRSLREGGSSGIRVLARVRYRQPLFPATLLFSNSRELGNSSCELVFDSPQKFVAPGQSAVFYRETGELIGGGVIM